MSWRQARSSLSELSHILSVAPKNHAAREKVIGVQISDVGDTGSHFSLADAAMVKAIADVDDPNRTRSGAAEIFNPSDKLAAPTTSKTLVTLIDRLQLIAADTLSVLAAVAVIVAAIAIVAVLSSVLLFCP